MVLNALHADAVMAEIGRIQPDVIIDELTSLPKRYTAEEMRIAAPHDRQIRLEGGGNLHRVALETGVKRHIVQSPVSSMAGAKAWPRRTNRLHVTQRPGLPAAWPLTCSMRIAFWMAPVWRVSPCGMDSFTVRAHTTIRRMEASPNSYASASTRD